MLKPHIFLKKISNKKIEKRSLKLILIRAFYFRKFNSQCHLPIYLSKLTIYKCSNWHEKYKHYLNSCHYNVHLFENLYIYALAFLIYSKIMK